MTRTATILGTLVLLSVALAPSAQAAAPAGASLDSVQEYFTTLHDRFVPTEARRVDAVIQWRIDGSGGGEWFAVIENGTLDVLRGTHRSPDLTITAPAGEWLQLLRGEIDGRSFFLAGRGEVDGNIRLAIRMKSIFPLS